MAKKSNKNPGGFEKSCISRLKRLINHKERHPNDINNKIDDKIKKCREGTYRK